MAVAVAVNVRVLVTVGVLVFVGVLVGPRGVLVRVGVLVAVLVAVRVRVAVLVKVGGMGVNVGCPQGICTSESICPALREAVLQEDCVTLTPVPCCMPAVAPTPPASTAP